MFKLFFFSVIKNSVSCKKICYLLEKHLLVCNGRVTFPKKINAVEKPCLLWHEKLPPS